MEAERWDAKKEGAGAPIRPAAMLLTLSRWLFSVRIGLEVISGLHEPDYLVSKVLGKERGAPTAAGRCKDGLSVLRVFIFA